MASTQVNLYEAKTNLSSLVERASKGEAIIIAKSGKPMAVLSPLPTNNQPAESDQPKIYRTFGDNVLGITFLADDWEADIPIEYFEDPSEDEFYAETPTTPVPK